VLRDYQGQFIAALCKFIPHLTSAMMVEAMAMKEGLSLQLVRGATLSLLKETRWKQSKLVWEVMYGGQNQLLSTLIVWI
jgi:hypothetical protein